MDGLAFQIENLVSAVFIVFLLFIFFIILMIVFLTILKENDKKELEE